MLKKLQKEVLELYREYHASPPTILKLFRRNLGRYLLVIIFYVLAFLFFSSFQLQNYAYLALGLLIGALLRDLTAFNRFSKTWKITESVLDWERINILLENEPGKKKE